MRATDLVSPTWVFRDHQPHASEATRFKAAQDLTQELLTLAVTHLQAKQFTAAVNIEAHGLDNGTRSDLQRFAEPAVQVRRVYVEVRVAQPSSVSSRKA